MKYKSHIELKYKLVLEELIFFNPQQIRYIQEITHTIEEFGKPIINETEMGLCVKLDYLRDVQNIFVLNDEETELIGIVIYFRESDEFFTLLHIAINNNYNSINNSENLVLMQILNELSKRLRIVKGVKNLKILYSDQVSLLKLK